jgi:hypothetical protein
VVGLGFHLRLGARRLLRRLVERRLRARLERVRVALPHGSEQLPGRLHRHAPDEYRYLRSSGASVYTPFKLDVLRVTGGRIAEITTFDGTLFEAFGLPATL